MEITTKGTYEKLGSSNALTYEDNDIIVLRSYSTLVYLYDKANDKHYFSDAYDISNTTMYHVRKFFQEKFKVRGFEYIASIRKQMKSNPNIETLSVASLIKLYESNL